MKSNNGVNSTIFLFSRFHQISLEVVLCQNTQNIITFMVRWEILSHLTMKVCCDPERRSGLKYTHKYAGNAVSRCFTSVPEILGFDFSRKYGVQYSILLISAKVLDQIKREWSHFFSTEPFLLAVFGWFLKSS